MAGQLGRGGGRVQRPAAPIGRHERGAGGAPVAPVAGTVAQVALERPEADPLQAVVRVPDAQGVELAVKRSDAQRLPRGGWLTGAGHARRLAVHRQPEALFVPARGYIVPDVGDDAGASADALLPDAGVHEEAELAAFRFGVDAQHILAAAVAALHDDVGPGIAFRQRVKAHAGLKTQTVREPQAGRVGDARCGSLQPQRLAVPCRHVLRFAGNPRVQTVAAAVRQRTVKRPLSARRERYGIRRGEGGRADGCGRQQKDSVKLPVEPLPQTGNRRVIAASIP